MKVSHISETFNYLQNNHRREPYVLWWWIFIVRHNIKKVKVKLSSQFGRSLKQCLSI